MSNNSASPPAESMLQRIRGEFTEMPGLRLTRQQAQRLWGLDDAACRAILDHLVDTKFLCQTGGDTYGRLTDGPVIFPAPRMAVSAFDRRPPSRKRAV